MNPIKYDFDCEKAKADLKRYFSKDKARLNSFGSKVNQTFEVYTFASMLRRLADSGWTISIHNPTVDGRTEFRLKFSTRGTPDKYSYASCQKDGQILQVRHQIRIATTYHRDVNKNPANICCDVAVIKDESLAGYTTDMAVPNDQLVTFGEAKHMSAFAELVAGFIGMVYELQPARLKRVRVKGRQTNGMPAPFLNVSGKLYRTAKGLEETIRRRRFDIDIYSIESPLYKELPHTPKTT